MSFLAKVFGKKKNFMLKAVQKLRDIEEMLIKEQKFLGEKIDLELEIAQKNCSLNKRGEKLIIILLGCECSSLTLNAFVVVAIRALMRKKKYQMQLQEIDGNISTIELRREAMEGANFSIAILQKMGDAAKALKAANLDM